VLDEEHLSGVHICPETMGKINQLGNFEEILQMCEAEERFLPCIDFGHLNSRMQGAMNSREAFAAALDEIRRRLGEERGRSFHVHFSKIAYTAGGEKCHLTFADTEYGPEPEPLMALFAERQMAPTVICESAGTQAEDAGAMRRCTKRPFRPAEQACPGGGNIPAVNQKGEESYDENTGS